MNDFKNNLLRNMIFALAVLAAALGLLGWRVMQSSKESGETKVAVLTYGTAEESRFPLDRDAVYDIETNGYTIHIQIENGAATFVQSPCPDHVCEQFGWLRDEGEWAVCAPALAMLQIESGQTETA